MRLGLHTFACQDRRVAQVLRLVAQDLTCRPSRVEAAQVANLEPAYFSKRFRKALGVTFTAWSAQVRVEAAKPLLASTDYRIDEVAAAVGYHNVTTFERNFRKYAGVCPREYRRQPTSQAEEDTKR